MTRPWLMAFGPLMIPTEDRETLRGIAINRTRDEFADAIWQTRSAKLGPVLPSHPDGWPVQRAESAPAANVTQIKSKARARP